MLKLTSSQRWMSIKNLGRSLVAAAICWGGIAAPATAAGPNRAEQVQAHLAAGEFGEATDLAEGAAAPAERRKLLKQVADAQLQAGEGEAALRTLRRGSPANEAGGNRSNLGGGGLADFSQLIELIQRNTSGPWQDVEGQGGTMSPFINGVKVSPQGILGRLTKEEETGALAAIGVQARQAQLSDELAQSATVRFISLRGVERELAECQRDGRPLPESMLRMGGLVRAQYVVISPDDHDVLIGGPAEPWEYNKQGFVIGRDSQRPTLNLDDFVTVFRAFATGHSDFGCTINTRDEGVKAMQEYAQASLARGPLSAGGGVKNFVNQLQRKLGMQDIVVWGVPADSRVARVLVEADYRMKLIGIDKLDAGKEIPSYFALLSAKEQANPPPMEALRWWLTMKYDSVPHSADRTVFEIRGSSVLCQSENQLLTADGQHLPTGKSESTNRRFAENFTKHYDLLAKRDLVFADTRNIFDLALIAALLHNEGVSGKIGWDFGAFQPDGNYHAAKYPAPKEVESVVNHKVYNNRDIVVQVAGGVRADLSAVLKNDELLPTEPGLKQVGDTHRIADRWFWNAR